MWNSTQTAFKRIGEVLITGQHGKALVATFTSHDQPGYEATLKIVFQMEHTEPGRLTFYPFFYADITSDDPDADTIEAYGPEYGPAGDSYEEAVGEMEKLLLGRPVALDYLDEAIADELTLDESVGTSETTQDLGDFLDSLSAQVGSDDVRILLEDAIERGILTEKQVRALDFDQVTRLYHSIVGAAQSAFVKVLA